MKKQFSKILSFILAAVMVFSAIPAVNVFAADIVDSGKCGDNLTWALDDNGTLTISGAGKMYGYENSYDVPWYDIRDDIKTIAIEDGVTSIGDCAFYNCYNLANASIGNGVTSIGSSAFEDCYVLTDITIGNSVTSIGDYAFEFCNNLTSVEIPKNVRSIGNMVFLGCDKLTSISVAKDNTHYSSSNGVLFNKNKTVLMIYPFAKTEAAYTVPNSVKEISDYAIMNCNNLTSITIPRSVTSIGYMVFDGCDKLTSITVVKDNTSYSSLNGVLFSKNKKHC